MDVEKFNETQNRLWQAYQAKDAEEFNRAIEDAKRLTMQYPHILELLDSACNSYPNCNALNFISSAALAVVQVKQRS